MAAPASAYVTKNNAFVKAKMREEDGDIDTYVAKYLSGVRNDGGYSTSANTMKSSVRNIFKLDLLLDLRENGAVKGFVGGVKQGGSNEKFHNLTRRDSGSRLRHTDGNIYRMLNDAGLNTLGSGIMKLGYTLSGQSICYRNDTPCYFKVNAPFYDSASYTIDRGYNNSTWPDRLAEGLVPSRGMFADTVNGATNTSMGSGLYFRLRITSEEGTIQYTAGLDLDEMLPDINQITINKIPSIDTDYDEGTPTTIYIYTEDLLVAQSSVDVSDSEGTVYHPSFTASGVNGEVVLDKGRTRPVADGFYANPSYGFHVTDGVIDYTFRPYGSLVPTWRIRLAVSAIMTYPGTSGWLGDGFNYRMNVTATWVGENTEPDDQPPHTAVSITNIQVNGVTASGAVLTSFAWRGSNGLTVQTPPKVSISLPAGARTASSAYIYAKDGAADPPYVGITDYAYTPQTYRVFTELTQTGLTGGGIDVPGVVVPEA